MVFSYYDKFNRLNINNMTPLLFFILTPLIFIGNAPILLVSVISLYTILNNSMYLFDIEEENLHFQYIKEEKEEDEEEGEGEEEGEEEGEGEEAHASEEGEEDEEEEEEGEGEEAHASEEGDGEEGEGEGEEAHASEEENVHASEEDEENSYLIILTVEETKQKYIMNNLIINLTSKHTSLGSIKLVNLILVELNISEHNLEELKLTNKIYDYLTFDNKLNELEDSNLECAWRRYKHILSENEYKDNTYTIL